MNDFLDVFEGNEIIKTILTETDADFLKVLVGAITIGGGIYTAYRTIKYAIEKDKVRDLTELVSASTGMVEAVSPSKEIKGVIGSIFGSKDK
nr:MAG TPA: hypothetical protein [Caudoviricetes sp.]